MRITAPKFAAVAIVALASSVASATVMVRLSIDELAAQSDAIVVATPGDATSRWEGGHIVTDVSVRIDRVLGGGTDAPNVVVRLPGGVVEGTGQRVEGSPRLARGVQRVLFLRREAAGRYHIAGMAQGVLPVTHDAAGAAWIGPADPGGVALVDQDTTNHSRVAMPSAGMSLDTFVRTIAPMRLHAH